MLQHEYIEYKAACATFDVVTEMLNTTGFNVDNVDEAGNMDTAEHIANAIRSITKRKMIAQNLAGEKLAKIVSDKATNFTE